MLDERVKSTLKDAARKLTGPKKRAFMAKVAEDYFDLATNQLDKTRWPAQKLLQEYKAQQTVERGFRFLKDPLFFVSSVFVKKPQRVEALALIMALTLMVYTLADRLGITAMSDGFPSHRLG
jgi:transposase